MTPQNIEAELSYAYLHAIAGKAGMSCKSGDRHDDGYGVDAEVNFRGDTGHPYLRHIQLNIQLKATVKNPGQDPNWVSYFFSGKERYNKLRTRDSDIYKILVVLFLPDNPTEWLKCSSDELILKNAAYWTSLYGAPETTNDSGQTVYLPKRNLLTPDALVEIAKMAANKTVPNYTSV